ncbi:MAG TPA: hypothetical protein VFW92_11555 [Candidatus Limnocylindrales bacterium]|nr:hypothetical protein [Candidatus Limnocylindrales bacterium]
MAVRLLLKSGRVPEAERLDTSVDAVLAEEPSIGSISRSKGNLYAIVTVGPEAGNHAAEATELVAETIRRQYYYDESAGIPITLEKALRSANQRLRHGREGHGLVRGALGAVVAVVRGHELYVATTGAADAFLVRQARLLTLPEDERGPGMPDPDDARVDVWRGDLNVGDTIVLAARAVSALVGADELKNAAVTLHPQSAAEHLHHLYVAAGGTRADGLLVLEATEVAATRTERRLVPVRPAEPLAGAPERSPLPLADPIVDAAAAVQDRAREAREAAGEAVFGLLDRATDLLPRRRSRYRRVVPLATRQESQRRAAIAVLAFLGMLTVLAVGLWFLGGLRPGGPAIGRVNAGEQAVAAAQTQLAAVFGPGDLIAANPQVALTDLRKAWSSLDQAASLGVAATAIAPLRAQAQAGLDRLYGVVATSSTLLFSFADLAPGAELRDLVVGPDGAAYVIDRKGQSVIRVDLAARTAKAVVKSGQKGIGQPWALAVGGPDVLILDGNGALWRWRPADAKGGGTLAKLRLSTATPLGRNIENVAAYVRSADTGLSFFYVLDPQARQILRYSPAADGSGYPSDPADYLAAPADLSKVTELYIDGDVFALSSTGLTRYESGQTSSFHLAEPPDAADIRPGHSYQALAGTGARGEGRLYLWDASHQRVLAFDKSDGSYIEQYIVRTGQPAYTAMEGMIVVTRSEGQAPVLVWASGTALYASPLEAAPTPGASPSPSPSASPKTTATPKPTATRKGKTPKPSR